MDYYRRNKTAIPLPVLAEQEEDETDNEVMDEAMQDMISMMNDLPPEYCEALCLTELDGLSQKEYADRIGIPYSSAKSRVQRSRKLLRDMLLRCCHYEFDKYGTVLSISANCCCCNPGKA
jgi:RNA polymerase sigma-70 factor (ECF subfamily)